MMIVDEHDLRVFSGDEELSPLSNAGTITADRGWSPHVQGRLSVAAPTDDALTAPGSVLTIELTQRFGSFALTRDLTDLYGGLTTAALTAAFGGGTTATITALITAGAWTTPPRAATGRQFELIVTKRTRSRGEHQLELASREVLFQDWLWYDVDANLEGEPLTFTADTVSRFIERILAAAGSAHFGAAAAIPVLLDQSSIVAITPTTHTIATGSGIFAAAEGFLAQARQRIYSPGDSSVRIVDYPFTSPGTITVTESVNLIDWEITDDRERHTLVRFTGTDLNPAAKPIYSSRAFPDLAPPPEVIIDAPHKPLLVTGLISGVTAEVEPFMNRAGLDESPVKLVTINDYSVMPGSPITYTLPDSTTETDTIDAITWQLGGRFEMDVWI